VDTVGVSTPVPVLVTTTDAPPTAAPVASVTVPVIVPLAVCEKAAAGINNVQSAMARIRMIFPLLSEYVKAPQSNAAGTPQVNPETPIRL
jgi:hypothetical protein